MIGRSYVLDAAVRDVPAAVRSITAILGMEAVPMPADADPSGQLEAGHLPVGGINALGLMGVKGGAARHPDNSLNTYMERFGERIFLLGFLVDDVDAHVDAVRSAGLTLAWPEPVPYADGRLITTEPAHGTVFEFAQHHGHEITERWQRYRADLAKNAVVHQAIRADVVVEDLDAAARLFSAVLGAAPADSSDAPAGTRGVEFGVGGLETIRLLTVSGDPVDGYATEIARWLHERGEGPMTISFACPDIDRAAKTLAEEGVVVIQRSAVNGGETIVAGPVHGLVMEFVQR